MDGAIDAGSDGVPVHVQDAKDDVKSGGYEMTTTTGHLQLDDVHQDEAVNDENDKSRHSLGLAVDDDECMQFVGADGQPLSPVMTGSQEESVERVEVAVAQGATVGAATTKDEPVKSEPIKIFLRLRNSSALASTCRVVDERTIRVEAPETSHAHRTRNRCNGTYTFHHVFAEHTPQSDFYHAAVRPLVRDVLAGHHRSVAAYGVTSSGKTFTVQGTSAHPGLVFTALEEIFQAKQNATCAYRVSMTAVEMYNEKLFDLLVAAPSVQEERMGVKRRPLELKHASLDPLPGAERWAVQGMEDAASVLQKVKLNRQVNSTLANHESSRSHCIIMILLEREDNGAPYGRLMILDLAGSERHQATQAQGHVMREAGDINRSLSALQNCISVIRQHQQTKTLSTSATFPHIPFRNSKLTQLLAPDLSGSGELALIVCVNGAPEFFDETTHVLEFSAVAGKVQLVQRPRIDTGLHSTVATPVVKTGTVRKRLRFDDAVTAESPLVRCDENCHEETESPYFECEGCEALYEQVLALRSELVLVDARVRQELTDEHAKNTERLQEHYHTSMMQSMEQNEEKLNRKMEVLSRSYENEIKALKKELILANKAIRVKDDELDQLRRSVSDDAVARDAMQRMDRAISDGEQQIQQLERDMAVQIAQLEQQYGTELKRRDADIERLQRQLVHAQDEAHWALKELHRLEGASTAVSEIASDACVDEASLSVEEERDMDGDEMPQQPLEEVGPIAANLPTYNSSEDGAPVIPNASMEAPSLSEHSSTIEGQANDEDADRSLADADRSLMDDEDSEDVLVSSDSDSEYMPEDDGAAAVSSDGGDDNSDDNTDDEKDPHTHESPVGDTQEQHSIRRESALVSSQGPGRTTPAEDKEDSATLAQCPSYDKKEDSTALEQFPSDEDKENGGGGTGDNLAPGTTNAPPAKKKRKLRSKKAVLNADDDEEEDGQTHGGVTFSQKQSSARSGAASIGRTMDTAGLHKLFFQ